LGESESAKEAYRRGGMLEDELLTGDNLVYGSLFERKLLRNFSWALNFPNCLYTFVGVLSIFCLD
jgi:hypothetical protein